MNGGRRAINPGRVTQIKMDQIVNLPTTVGAATAMKVTGSQFKTAEGSLSVVRDTIKTGSVGEIALGITAMPWTRK